jgi:hypothetical protein
MKIKLYLSCDGRGLIVPGWVDGIRARAEGSATKAWEDKFLVAIVEREKTALHDELDLQV